MISKAILDSSKWKNQTYFSGSFRQKKMPKINRLLFGYRLEYFFLVMTSIVNYKQIPVHKSCFINLLICCFVLIDFENSEFVKNYLFQGGPGSTSMYGLLKENGPYLVEAKYLPFGDPHLVKNHYRLF